MRAGVDEETHAALLASPSHVEHEGDFQVVGHTLIGVVAAIFDDFFPAALRPVDLHLHGTDSSEIFLARITDGDTSTFSYEVGGFDGRGERDATQVDAAVDTDGQVAAVFAHLCGGPSSYQEEHAEYANMF